MARRRRSLPDFCRLSGGTAMSLAGALRGGSPPSLPVRAAGCPAGIGASSREGLTLMLLGMDASPYPLRRPDALDSTSCRLNGSVSILVEKWSLAYLMSRQKLNRPVQPGAAMSDAVTTLESGTRLKAQDILQAARDL